MKNYNLIRVENYYIPEGFIEGNLSIGEAVTFLKSIGEDHSLVPFIDLHNELLIRKAVVGYKVTYNGTNRSGLKKTEYDTTQGDRIPPSVWAAIKNGNGDWQLDYVNDDSDQHYAEVNEEEVQKKQPKQLSAKERAYVAFKQAERTRVVFQDSNDNLIVKKDETSSKTLANLMWFLRLTNDKQSMNSVNEFVRGKTDELVIGNVDGVDIRLPTKDNESIQEFMDKLYALKSVEEVTDFAKKRNIDNINNLVELFNNPNVEQEQAAAYIIYDSLGLKDLYESGRITHQDLSTVFPRIFEEGSTKLKSNLNPSDFHSDFVTAKSKSAQALLDEISKKITKPKVSLAGMLSSLGLDPKTKMTSLIIEINTLLNNSSNITDREAAKDFVMQSPKDLISAVEKYLEKRETLSQEERQRGNIPLLKAFYEKYKTDSAYLNSDSQVMDKRQGVKIDAALKTLSTLFMNFQTSKDTASFVGNSVDFIKFFIQHNIPMTPQVDLHELMSYARVLPISKNTNGDLVFTAFKKDESGKLVTRDIVLDDSFVDKRADGGMSDDVLSIMDTLDTIFREGHGDSGLPANIQLVMQMKNNSDNKNTEYLVGSDSNLLGHHADVYADEHAKRIKSILFDSGVVIPHKTGDSKVTNKQKFEKLIASLTYDPMNPMPDELKSFYGDLPDEMIQALTMEFDDLAKDLAARVPTGKMKNPGKTMEILHMIPICQTYLKNLSEKGISVKLDTVKNISMEYEMSNISSEGVLKGNSFNGISFEDDKGNVHFIGSEARKTGSGQIDFLSFSLENNGDGSHALQHYGAETKMSTVGSKQYAHLNDGTSHRVFMDHLTSGTAKIKRRVGSAPINEHILSNATEEDFGYRISKVVINPIANLNFVCKSSEGSELGEATPISFGNFTTLPENSSTSGVEIPNARGH